MWKNWKTLVYIPIYRSLIVENSFERSSAHKVDMSLSPQISVKWMRRKGSVMGISEKDYQELWNSTLQIIKDSNTYDDAIFNTYIKPTRLFRINDDVALISVPNKISSSIFSGSLDIWRSAFAQTAGGDYTLQVILNKDVEKMVPQQVMRQRTDTLFEDHFNKLYTFDNFVVGKNNREAYAASIACCNYPGQFNNPLMIYGNSGLGKTGVAIDHQRIVELSGIIAAGDRCRIGFPVVFADDEVVECVQLIEMIFKKRIRALPHHLLRNHLFHIFVQDDLQRIVATGCLGEGRTPDVQAAREDRTGNFIWDRNQRHIIIDAEQSGRFDIGVEYGIIVSIAVFDDLESGIPQLLVIFFRYSHNRPLSTHPFYTNLWGNTMSTL